ncbi:hypothetical protein [Alkalibacillus haloalkaliphilus]|uniref:Uncharacterized protein n=1 Tax=Alkalibacillus haloalkaliphilus TaxID=94136 RepID=A0A511W5K6_9BACI|nr:hypothetical protein [Alkalibacillus haloalkaliphilus]GEN45578.1 hypothetical protein AHA02nite_13540 [Alkalibacillus haloalkaliphilus]
MNKNVWMFILILLTAIMAVINRLYGHPVTLFIALVLVLLAITIILWDSFRRRKQEEQNNHEKGGYE